MRISSVPEASKTASGQRLLVDEFDANSVRRLPMAALSLITNI
jgi:hypothetical protein